MKINGRDILFKPNFIAELEEIKEYLGQFGNQPLQNFLTELEYLLTDRIPNYPESYPEYKKKLTPQKEYRRALFKKKYYVIYRVDSTTIDYILIYHSSRNPDNISIE